MALLDIRVNFRGTRWSFVVVFQCLADFEYAVGHASAAIFTYMRDDYHAPRIWRSQRTTHH